MALDFTFPYSLQTRPLVSLAELVNHDRGNAYAKGLVGDRRGSMLAWETYVHRGTFAGRYAHVCIPGKKQLGNPTHHKQNKCLEQKQNACDRRDPAA